MSKLSRKRTRGGTLQSSKFDDSADDFESLTAQPPPPPPAKATRTNELKEKTPNDDVCDENALPPCPLCAKTFKPGQAAQRGNHLRGCGSKRGMTTEELLQVLRMEERQARERVAMGLPAVVGKEMQQQPAAKKQRKTKSQKNSAPEVQFSFLFILSRPVLLTHS